MDLSLSENIRAYRKQRKLTQEQFAEVLGVSTGAVHKWESGISIPELFLIIKMADFFDISVDGLLGYKKSNNSINAADQRLSALCRNGDTSALSEAELALKKYPHSFIIVYKCASVYRTFGMEQHSKELLNRALELYEQALVLISQNPYPNISESTIFGQIGGAYLSMGELEKGLEILKRHNAGGMFNSDIGLTLSMLLHRSEDAQDFLSDALLNSVFELMNAIIGYAFMYSNTGDYKSLYEIVSWGQALMLELRETEDTNFIDKTNAGLLILLAHAQLHTGCPKDTQMSLQKAASLVRLFDAAPDYSIGGIRFAVASDKRSFHDMLGGTAKESTEYIIEQLRDPTLFSMWKDIKD